MLSGGLLTPLLSPSIARGRTLGIRHFWDFVFRALLLSFFLPPLAAAQIRQPPTSPVSESQHVDARLLPPETEPARGATRASTFACSSYSLRDDVTCVFDTEKAPTKDERRLGSSRDLRKENRAFATAMATKLCEQIVDDGILRTSCVSDTTQVSHSVCSIATTTLADRGGNFRRESADCYTGLRAVLESYRTATSLHGECCRCATSCGAPEICRALVAGRGISLANACSKKCATACALGVSLAPSTSNALGVKTP